MNRNIWGFPSGPTRPEMAGGLKIWVKEVERLHYLFSETNSEGVTAELICVLSSHIQFFYLFMKNWHIHKIDLSIQYPFCVFTRIPRIP